MKLSKLTPQKNTAQAMVEFAIVLPILLLLLYGLLEAGRLLFMYSTIVTASRQAARYGSATGEGINPGVMRYQDCAGIRVAANRVDFLNAFDEYDVIIQHDTGPGTTAYYYCTNVTDAPPDPSQPLDPSDSWAPASGSNTERIIVTIEGDFNPIIPRIVPFIARTEAGGNPITAISARTIITGVSIEVTPPPGSGGGGGSGLSLSISPSPSTFTGANETITYTFTLTNNGTTDITGPFTITGAPFSVDCSGATSPLAGGASTDCTAATYVTTAADVTAGFFEFTATASASGGITSNDETSRINLATASPGLSLSITTNPGAYLNVGDSITYTYSVTNGTSQVSGLAITDDRVSGISCALTTVPPSTTTSCTGTYTVTQADIDAGSVVNHATASASDGIDTFTSGQAIGTAILAQPELTLSKSVTPLTATPGDTVTYNFTLSNSGNVPLSTVAISDPLLGGPVAGCSTGSLAAGAQITCAGTYNVRSADVVSNKIINTATASGTFGSTSFNSDPASATLTVLTNSLFLEVSVSPTSVTLPNQTITYTYTLTNGTAQPVEGPYVLTGSLTAALNNCFSGTLASGNSQSCTKTYSAQADFDAGATSIQNNDIKVTACVPSSNCKNQNLIESNIVDAPPVTISGQSAILSLDVSVSLTRATTLGQQITYRYRLTNDGNVNLKQPFSLNDPKFGAITCTTTDIIPGAFKDCTKTYNITQADIDAGSIPSRQATASAMYGSQTVPASAPVPLVTTFDGARLKLEIFANPTTYPAAPASQPIIYTYRLTNTGTIPLNPSTRYLTSSQQSDGRTLTVSCPSTPLAEPGDSVDCTATDNVNGPLASTLTNTATAQASDGTKVISSNTATVTVSNPVLTCNVTNIFGTAINNPGGMTATFTNNTGIALKIKDVTVRWNHNDGQNGNDKTLKMQNAQLNGVIFREWIGSSNWLFVPVATITPTSDTYLPPGTSTFTFIFHQTYRNWESGPEPHESVALTFDMPGCEGVTVTYTRP